VFKTKWVVFHQASVQRLVQSSMFFYWWFLYEDKLAAVWCWWFTSCVLIL